MTVDPDAFAALLAKYTTMRQMRLDDRAGSEPDPRKRMADLASCFPGALREIDELPLAEIDSRIAVLQSVVDGSAEAPQWASCFVHYHGILRAALRLKRICRGDDLAAASARLHREYEPACDEPPLSFWDADRLASVLRPAAGRLNPWVIAEVAMRHGLEASAVTDLLFSQRHRHSHRR